jgi:hypothetical protein
MVTIAFRASLSPERRVWFPGDQPVAEGLDLALKIGVDFLALVGEFEIGGNVTLAAHRNRRRWRSRPDALFSRITCCDRSGFDQEIRVGGLLFDFG